MCTLKLQAPCVDSIHCQLINSLIQEKLKTQMPNLIEFQIDLPNRLFP